MNAIRNWLARPASKATWIIASVIAIVLAFIGDNYIEMHIQELNAALFATKPTAVIPIITPIPTPSDAWNSIRGCDLSFAKVQLKTIPADGNNAPSFDGASEHEVWATFVFGDYKKLNATKSDIDPWDRWDNPISDVRYNARLDDIPLNAQAVWIYNPYGYLAGWDRTGNEKDLTVYGFCHQPQGNLDWTPKSKLDLAGTYQFSYKEDYWKDYSFKVKVYVGRMMNAHDDELARFQIFALDHGDFYSSLPYIGPSSSNIGYFDYDEKTTTLWWKFQHTDPYYNVDKDTGIYLPFNREIVVETDYQGGATIWQRFVFHTDHRGHYSGWKLENTNDASIIFPN